MSVTSLGRLPNGSALLAAGLSAAAGLLHIAVIRTHLAESTVDAVLMLAAAWLQLGFAVVLLIAPTRMVRLTGALGLLSIAVGWGVARVTGLPFGHSQGTPEDVRLLGTVATVLGVLAALAALAGARPGADPTAAGGGRSPAPFVAAGVTLAALLSAVLLVTPTGHGGEAGRGDDRHNDTTTRGHDSDPSGGRGHGGSGGGHHGPGATNGPTSDSAGADGAPSTTPATPAPAAPSSSESPAGDDGHEHEPVDGH